MHSVLYVKAVVAAFNQTGEGHYSRGLLRDYELLSEPSFETRHKIVSVSRTSSMWRTSAAACAAATPLAVRGTTGLARGWACSAWLVSREFTWTRGE